MNRNKFIVQLSVAAMLVAQTGVAVASCKFDDQNKAIVYLFDEDIRGNCREGWRDGTFNEIPFWGPATHGMGSGLYDYSIIKNGESIYAGSPLDALNYAFEGVTPSIPEGTYQKIITGIEPNYSYSPAWGGPRMVVPEGIEISDLKAKTLVDTVVDLDCSRVNGLFVGTRDYVYKYELAICYKGIDFTGIAYNRKQRTGESYIEVDPDVSLVSSNVEVVNEDGAVVFSTEPIVLQNSPTGFTFEFDLKGATPGEYTLRVSAVDNENSTEIQNTPIIIDPLIFVENSYDPKTRTGHVTVEDFWNNPQSAFFELRNADGSVAYRVSGGARAEGEGQFTYPYDLGNAPVGTYNVVAIVTDGQGDPAEADLGSVVIEPIVFSNYGYTPETQVATITIQDVGEHPQRVVAELVDAEGDVARTVEGVQESANGELFDYSFRYGGVASGTYTIRLVATDTWGNKFTYADAMHEQADGGSGQEVHLVTAEIHSFTYDELSRDGVIVFTDSGKEPKSGTVVLTNRDDPSEQWTMPAALVRDPDDEAKFSYTFNLNDAPEGYFTLSFDIFDTFETTVSQTYPQTILIDKTGPVISINQPEKVRALQDIQITVKDNFDASPDILSVHLAGGPDNADVDLQATLGADGKLTIADPGLFPSLSENDPPYSITVSVVDDQRNESVKVTGFSYTTDVITALDGMDNKLWVPAVEYQFLRQGGKATINTDPIRDSNQQPITGAYDVVAMLKADAPAPIVLNGVELQPGTRAVIGKNDFTATGGRISVLAHAAVEDTTGIASVVITTTAPYAPAVQADLHLWKADAVLESKQWVFRQVIDKLDVIAMPASNVPCRTTVDDAAARAADPIRDPVCLVVWTETPDEAEVSDGFKNGMRVAGLAGQAVKIGQQNIAYDLYLYSGDGQKIQIGSGSKPIEVVSALGAIELGLNREKPQVYRTIEDVDASFKQTKGPACAVTLDASQAINAAATATPGAKTQQLTCLFEWRDMPGTLVQDKYATVPKAIGQLNDLGIHNLGWRLSTFSKAGVRITLAEQTAALDVIDPPAPTIALQPEGAQIAGDHILVAPVDAASFGNVQIDAINADLRIEIEQDGKPFSSETATVSRYGDTQSVIRGLPVPKNVPLWHKSSYTVKASYARLPEVKSQFDIEGYVAPKTSIRPAVESDTRTAVDTELLPVTVAIQDVYKFRDPYDENTMGVWDVRVMRQDSKDGDQPVTDWVRTQAGSAEFDLTIGEVESRTVRFYAEAKLVSPIPGYERIEQSQRPLFFAVLLGGEINADVVTRKLSGEAPFKATFKAVLQDREMYNSTGEITYQISKDDGATWESFTPPERYKFQYSATFNKGSYRVRARTTNKYSGKQATTSQIEIIAYEKPELQIDGPEVVFVGSSQKLTAKPTLRVLNEATGQIEVKPVALDAADIQWSTDGGKTYTQTGESITLSSSDPDRFYVWAKVRSADAPSEDGAAYSITKKSVEFKAIRAPRVRVIGPSIIETGKTYTFTVNKDMPYAKMEGVLKGYFTMPDGTKVEADKAEYTPTKQDLAKGYLMTTYTAWVEGYQDKGAEGAHTLRSRVWQYVWPNFTVDYRADAPVAPAIIELRARTTNYGGQLEEPKYEWEIPDAGMEVIDARNAVARTIQVTDPGDYLVKVTISDARGNKSVVDVPFKIGQPEPYHLDLTYTASNPDLREPVDILIRANITGGHPKDRIESVQWLTDGQPIEGTKTYGRTTLTQGNHKIGLKITSLMGKTEQSETPIVVVPNKVPVCSMTSRETVGSVIIYADCTDEDGRVRMYEWNIGGEIRTNSSRLTSITKRPDEPLPNVSVVAIDDSEGRSAEIHFTGVTPPEEPQP